jgi:hypothetical protein
VLYAIHRMDCHVEKIAMEPAVGMGFIAAIIADVFH